MDGQGNKEWTGGRARRRVNAVDSRRHSITKVPNQKEIKSLNPPKSRNTSSNITSGHCITDDDIRENYLSNKSQIKNGNLIRAKKKTKNKLTPKLSQIRSPMENRKSLDLALLHSVRPEGRLLSPNQSESESEIQEKDVLHMQTAYSRWHTEEYIHKTDKLGRL